MKDLDSIVFVATAYMASTAVVAGRPWPQSAIATVAFLVWNYRTALRKRW